MIAGTMRGGMRCSSRLTLEITTTSWLTDQHRRWVPFLVIVTCSRMLVQRLWLL